MLEINNIYHLDCLKGMQKIKEQGMKVDLIVTDPPYYIKEIKAGGSSRLAKQKQQVSDELYNNNLTAGIAEECLNLMWALMKTPNIYVWCNGAQIVQYLDFFVNKHSCSFEILIWSKTNPMPLFSNKYLADKEYCIYFRKGGYCKPIRYETARTVYHQPLNVKDKRLYNHPTIKPLNIITNIILNSSKENDTILDPFMGSGTTAEACIRLKRNYIGFEINKNYFEASQRRLASI